MDIAGIEYLETPDGRRVFYDINANSNLRRPIGEAFGFDPFERVADFLEGGFNMEVLQSVTEEDGCRSFPFKTFARS